MKRAVIAILISSLGLIPAVAAGIIIRHDVPDSKYLVPASAFPSLVDMPGSGHGVLIAKQWVVTAAHATGMMRMMPQHRYVIINGKPRSVARIILYPGFEESIPEYKRMIDQLVSGDGAASMVETVMIKSASRDDIGLIKLDTPIDDVEPVPLYRDADEEGKKAKMYGKGAAGNGLTGQYPDSPQRGKLRRAYNVISSSHEQWLVYTFDRGPNALPLEGAAGSGDSGGPVLIKKEGTWKLAGLVSWDYWEGDFADYTAGRYGQSFYNVRVSHYAGWIDSVMVAHQ